MANVSVYRIWEGCACMLSCSYTGNYMHNGMFSKPILNNSEIMEVEFLNAKDLNYDR